MATFKFYWNGIKVDGGKLQRASYYGGQHVTLPNGTISITAKDYSGFSKEVWEAFSVEDASDLQSDYFAKEVIRVAADHPMYDQVRAALADYDDHYARRSAKAAFRFAGTATAVRG